LKIHTPPITAHESASSHVKHPSQQGSIIPQIDWSPNALEWQDGTVAGNRDPAQPLPYLSHNHGNQHKPAQGYEQGADPRFFRDQPVEHVNVHAQSLALPPLVQGQVPQLAQGYARLYASAQPLPWSYPSAYPPADPQTDTDL